MAQKHALLIGINEYPYLDKNSQLTASHLDVCRIKRVLEEKFGFSGKDIKCLLSPQASRDSILGAMRQLLAGSRPGDLIVFYFSGHGSRSKGAHLKAPSVWYETIMPYDSGRSAMHPEGVDRDITDREIYEWLQDVAEITSNIVLIIDSCFAGSIVRDGLSSSGNKGGIAPEENRENFSVDRLRQENSPPTKNNFDFLPKGRSGWLPVSDTYVLLAASREYEAALTFKKKISDAHGKKSEKSVSLFTYYLVESLRRAKADDTYRDIWERLVPRVARRSKENQHPQIEGNSDRLLFSVKERPPHPFLRVEKRKKDLIILSGGKIHGVDLFSIWSIYPEGTKTFKLDRRLSLGKIKVASVDSFTSEAEIIEEVRKGAVAPGMRAIPEKPDKPSGQGFLKVLIEGWAADEGFGAVRSRLKRELQSTPSVKIVDEPESADVLIKFGSIRAENSVSSGSGFRSYLSIHDAAEQTSLLVPPQLFAKDTVNFRQIGENLKKIGEYRRLYYLRNPAGVLAGKIDFQIFTQLEDRSWLDLDRTLTAKNALPVIKITDRIALRLVNRFSDPVYFCILDMGVAGDISILYPKRRGSNSGKLLDPFRGEQKALDDPALEDIGIAALGFKPYEEFRLSFPENFPFILPEDGRQVPDIIEGIEIYKVIISTRPMDLGFIEQRGVRSHEATKETDKRLERMVAETLRGDALYGGEETLSALKDEWCTIEKKFILRAA